jgi:hypothetical protein
LDRADGPVELTSHWTRKSKIHKKYIKVSTKKRQGANKHVVISNRNQPVRN